MPEPTGGVKVPMPEPTGGVKVPIPEPTGGVKVVAALCNASVEHNKRSKFTTPKYVPIYPVSCPNSIIRNEDRETFFKYHNDARRRVAKGEEPNTDGNIDGAKNMHKLVSANVQKMK
ncbi:hypothetical protein OESDEN_19692 [Oesophagostomum dentatum]|uniref:SCP domain-containing protein n=1 Tax=Oesophagostomum dentatum TaxID=61180 RepID=A0A0B1S9T7_OESDE|nr:hypothetical protein OESDEN_19692 [Oesophagostomum dentatum]